MLTIKERKSLRKNLLQGLYVHNFESKGVPVQTTKDEVEQNVEKALAYDYLLGKGLITVESGGGRFLKIKITVHGIDLVECLEKE